jgi:hypothetical protein
MRGILEALAAELKIHGLIDVEEAFIDGSFAPSKKGAPRSGKQSGVRDRKSWLWHAMCLYPSDKVRSF